MTKSLNGSTCVALNGGQPVRKISLPHGYHVIDGITTGEGGVITTND